MNFDPVEEREEKEEADSKKMEVKEKSGQKVTTDSEEGSIHVAEQESSPMDENAEWAQVRFYIHVYVLDIVLFVILYYRIILKVDNGIYM